MERNEKIAIAMTVAISAVPTVIYAVSRVKTRTPKLPKLIKRDTIKTVATLANTLTAN